MNGEILRAEGLTKTFGLGGGKTLTAVDHVSFTVRAGRTLGIVGESGSGKSTLWHCVSGVLTPTSGQVVFNNAVLSAASDAARSRTRLADFGFVFQDHQLLPELSALDNVALPAMLNGNSRSKARAKAQELLNQLGLGSMVNRRPGQVSGGQAQRIAIARALVTSPAVIFADEPTGALDQATGHEVMQLLTAVVQRTGAALVMVTHDSRVADWMERRIEIRDGIIHDDRLVGGRR